MKNSFIRALAAVVMSAPLSSIAGGVVSSEAPFLAIIKTDQTDNAKKYVIGDLATIAGCDKAMKTVLRDKMGNSSMTCFNNGGQPVSQTKCVLVSGLIERDKSRCTSEMIAPHFKTP